MATVNLAICELGNRGKDLEYLQAAGVISMKDWTLFRIHIIITASYSSQKFQSSY